MNVTMNIALSAIYNLLFAHFDHIQSDFATADFDYTLLEFISLKFNVRTIFLKMRIILIKNRFYRIFDGNCPPKFDDIRSEPWTVPTRRCSKRTFFFHFKKSNGQLMRKIWILELSCCLHKSKRHVSFL